MATLSIFDLPAVGSDLLMDSESFLTDITDNEFSGIMGGYDEGDWCGTTRVTRPPIPRPGVNFAANSEVRNAIVIGV